MENQHSNKVQPDIQDKSQKPEQTVFGFLQISLNSMFGDFQRIFPMLINGKIKSLFVNTIISFGILTGLIYSESYIPWWSGFIIGALWGALFGFVGIWLFIKLYYGIFFVFRRQIKHDIYQNIVYASLGPLLFFAFSALLFKIGSMYFSLSWYSATPFLLLGILWSGFTFARFLNTERSAYGSSLLLSFIYLVGLLLTIAYLFPLVYAQIAKLVQSIGFLKSIVIN